MTTLSNWRSLSIGRSIAAIFTSGSIMKVTTVVHTSVLDEIGNTPMHEVSRIDTGKCRLLLKLENQNPGGSIKDRIGKVPAPKELVAVICGKGGGRDDMAQGGGQLIVDLDERLQQITDMVRDSLSASGEQPCP